MTLRLSTGVTNGLTQGLGFGSLFLHGSILIYSGAQPVSADAAVTGTLLGRVTKSSGALTQETQASGTIVITAAAGGSIDTVLVNTLNIIPGGAVSATTGDTAATASSLCDAINRDAIYSATVSSSTVTIHPRPGVGAAHNTYTLSCGLTTVTATYGGGTITGGVAAVNGLSFGQPASGVIAKPAGEVWSFNGIAVGTAGWFRFIGAQSDAGALLSAAPWQPRVDGSIAVSGGDMALSNISVAIGAPNTVDVFRWTQPAS